MLKGISPLISPELLCVMSSMGHGDQMVIADAHFPAHSMNSNTLRADGLAIPALLEAVLALFPLDTYAESPVAMMSPVEGDSYDPLVRTCYDNIIKHHFEDDFSVTFYERFEFYEQAKQAFAILITGDVAKYGNIILTKGLVMS